MPTMRDRFARAAAELGRVAERIDESEVEAFMAAIEKAPRIFLVGAGREGLSTKAFAMRLTHLGKPTHWIWDDTTPGIAKGDLVIVVSGGGSIGHIDYVFDRAREAGAEMVVVTGDPGGVTPQKAKAVLFLPAAVYKGKAEVVASEQPMGNLFEQALFILFDQIAVALAEQMQVSKAAMESRHRNVE
ncbi:MAG TPA: SIS domain-containing protein [Candidatus Binatia bacterium]|nr:SIS domain-containing protein [Candidatus Binatia bacterium]